MSKSNPKRKLTKAGVALSADARRKLQALADWIDLQVVMGQTDPQVRLAWIAGVARFTTAITGPITYVSVVGALVQMYKPFKLSDSSQLTHDVHRIRNESVSERAAEILGIKLSEVRQLLAYLHRNTATHADVVTKLRALK